MKRIMLEKLFFPILCLVILLLYYLGTYDTPNPKLTMLLAMPISYAMGIISILVIIIEVMNCRKKNLVKKNKNNYSISKKVVLFLIIVFLYIAFFYVLGFLIDSIILIFVLMLFLKLNLKLTLIITLIFPLLIFFIFTRLLYVPLPWGILESFQGLFY